jgi:hypothetical protein
MREACPHPRPDALTVATLPGLLYFIREREAIRLARENGHPAPWTADPVLARYRFTNVRRRDDRVSRWVIERIIRPNEHRADLWFILLITRLVNWPPTLQRLIEDGVLFRPALEFEPEEFSASIERFKAAGRKAYSGAYMVYPTKMDPGGVKSLAIARHIIAPALNLSDWVGAVLEAHPPSIAEFVARLSCSFGISTFMAGQVAADLTYCPQMASAADLRRYAPIGPGSSRGLNYLLNRAPHAGWNQASFNAELIKVRVAVARELGIDDLTLHDVQNCMCEYSKYCRTVRGEGSPKTMYRPETEF